MKNCSHPDTKETWEEIWPKLQDFIAEGYEVMKINYRSQHSMNFEARSERAQSYCSWRKSTR